MRKVEVENKCTGIYHGFFEELIFRGHESEKLESDVCAHIKQNSWNLSGNKSGETRD